VPGVADVQIGGDRKYAMRIWLDPDKLAAYRLTVQDVEDALRRQNLEVPAGRIESSSANSASPRAPTSTRWRSSTTSR
jgi:multidrug efflux pump